MTSVSTPVSMPAAGGGGPLITVAICTRNRADFLELAVRSVLAQIQDDTELLILDNVSTDTTAELARRLVKNHPNVRYVFEARTGLSIARNTAILQARGQFVIFLDDDATVEPGWLAAYQKFFTTPPSPKIAVAGGAVFPNYQAPPPAWLSPKENKYDLGDQPFRFSRLDSPWECNSAYSRRLTIEQGLFDARLGHIGTSVGAHEGADLTMRLQDAGYEIWWLPGAAIRHTIHASRVNLGWYCRSAFASGVASALKRLKSAASPGQRTALRVQRLAGAPFHFLLNVGVFLILFPLGKKAAAVNALRRALRIAGYAWQLTKPLTA
jgi:GT2 family glycosyltransferase